MTNPAFSLKGLQGPIIKTSRKGGRGGLKEEKGTDLTKNKKKKKIPKKKTRYKSFNPEKKVVGASQKEGVQREDIKKRDRNGDRSFHTFLTKIREGLTHAGHHRLKF